MRYMMGTPREKLRAIIRRLSTKGCPDSKGLRHRGPGGAVVGEQNGAPAVDEEEVVPVRVDGLAGLRGQCRPYGGGDVGAEELSALVRTLLITKANPRRSLDGHLPPCPRHPGTRAHS